MTKCISIQNRVGKKGGCCECPKPNVFDPYLSGQSACSISVEEEACVALARHYDDVK